MLHHTKRAHSEREPHAGDPPTIKGDSRCDQAYEPASDQAGKGTSSASVHLVKHRIPLLCLYIGTIVLIKALPWAAVMAFDFERLAYFEIVSKSA